MACVTSVSFSVHVNGCPLKPFKPAKGLRQGNLLFPYLFTLCMEYISRLFKEALTNQQFSYHPYCRKVGLTRLMFVDDLLLFSRADPDSLIKLIHTFKLFSKASALAANENKSNVYISGVSDYTKMENMEILNMPEGSFPSHIWGCLCTRRS